MAALRLRQARPALRDADRRRHRGDARPWASTPSRPSSRRARGPGPSSCPRRRGSRAPACARSTKSSWLGRHRARRARGASAISSPSRPPTRRSRTSARRARPRPSPDACWRRPGRGKDDTVLVGVDAEGPLAMAMGILRLEMGRELKLVDEKAFRFLWVTDFPLFEYDAAGEALRQPPPSLHAPARRGPGPPGHRPGSGPGQGLRHRAERQRGGRG